MPNPGHHSRLQLLQYSLLAFPLMFVGLPIYVYAPELYATQYKISLTAIGLSLLLLRIFDAFQDLLIGPLSDRYQSKRPLIIIIGAALLALGFWMIFNPVPNYAFESFVSGVLLSTSGFSILSINLQAIGALWPKTSTARTQITSWREALGLIGLLTAALAPTLLGGNTDPVLAYERLALLYLPALFICVVIFLIWLNMAKIPAAPTSKKPQSLKRIFDKTTSHFFGIYTLNTFASSIPAVLVLFFIGERLQAPQYTGLFLLVYFLSGACGMPFWQWAAHKFGKNQAWMGGMIAACVSFIWAFSLGENDVLAYGIICITSGLALGADLALPPSILADQIAKRGHQDIASSYFSCSAFLSKTALALATGIALPLLNVVGYQPGVSSNVNSGLYLSIGYALIPSALKALTAIWLYRFIRRQNHAASPPATKETP